jgi:putative ABC transport system ATP-binding protein
LRSDAAAFCTGLVKIYRTATGDVHALKGIDAAFPAGTVTAVVGPSGSGKSSLLRILAALDRPTAGLMQIGDVTVSALGRASLRRIRRTMVGYVFQRPGHNLIPYLTVRQHVALAARLRGAVDGAAIDDLLALLGLRDRTSHQPRQLSGGEQQRVAFAQAVVGGPPLVVADEPTAELDSATGERLLEAVASLTQLGTSFVVSTHDPRVIEAATRTLHLRHGALEAETEERRLSVIDEAGRIQLPPRALRLFRERRALIEVEGDHVRIEPP